MSEKNVNNVEKNVSASFGYVKKDILMLNDAFSDLHDKFQKLSNDHMILMSEIENLKTKVMGTTTKKKTPVKKIVKKTSKK